MMDATSSQLSQPMQQTKQEENQAKQVSIPRVLNPDTYKMANKDPMVFIIDNFFENPDLVRQTALETPKIADLRYWKGRRSQMLNEETLSAIKTRFEEITGVKYSKIQSHFQVCDVTDPLVYHCDQQVWAGAVYLTPNAPVTCGTSLWRSKRNGIWRKISEEDCQRNNKTYREMEQETFGNGALLDKNCWEEIDRIGNVYNRCVLWRGDLVHSCSGYFGHSDETRRLFQLFFLWD
jgi:hypothetical protein